MTSYEDPWVTILAEWMALRLIAAEAKRADLRGDNPETLTDHRGRVWVWDGVWGPDSEPAYRHCGMFWAARFVMDPDWPAVSRHLADDPCAVCEALR